MYFDGFDLLSVSELFYILVLLLFQHHTSCGDKAGTQPRR